MIQTTFLLAK